MSESHIHPVLLTDTGKVWTGALGEAGGKSPKCCGLLELPAGSGLERLEENSGAMGGSIRWGPLIADRTGKDPRGSDGSSEPGRPSPATGGRREGPLMGCCGHPQKHRSWEAWGTPEMVMSLCSLPEEMHLKGILCVLQPPPAQSMVQALELLYALGGMPVS